MFTNDLAQMLCKPPSHTGLICHFIHKCKIKFYFTELHKNTIKNGNFMVKSRVNKTYFNKYILKCLKTEFLRIGIKCD